MVRLELWSAVALWIMAALASQPVQAAVGARPLGMGGAFVALADDPNAIYWNPAGTVITPQTAFTYSSLLNDRANFSFNDYFAVNWCHLNWKKQNELSWTETFLEIGGILALQSTLQEFLGGQGSAQPENQEKKSQERIESPPETPPPPPDPYWGWHYYYWGPPYYHRPRHHRGRDGYDQGDDRRVPPPPAETPPPGAEGRKAYLEALGFSYQHNYNFLAAADQMRTGQWFNLAVGWRWLESPWAWGLNVRLDTEQIIRDRARYSASCFEMDLGILWRATDDLTLGLLAQDLLNTRLAWSPDLETYYATNLRLGASYQASETTVLAVQVSNLLGLGGAGQQYHLGLEQGIMSWLVVRAGLLDRDWTAGAGLDFWGLKMDCAYLSGSRPKHVFGVTWRF